MNTKATVALVLVGVLAIYSYGRSERSAGARAERAKAVQARVDTLTVRMHTVDTLYRERVRTLTKTLAVYDSVRITDTVSVKFLDTVRVFVSRDAADSAVSMCRLTVFSCQQRAAASDSLIATLRMAVEAERRNKGNPWPSRALWGLSGAVLCQLICKD